MAKDCYANKKNQGDEAKKKDIVCCFCRKKGHKKSECRSRLKEQGNAAADGELAFMGWHGADGSGNWCQAIEPEEPKEYAFMAVDGGDSLIGESTYGIDTFWDNLRTMVMKTRIPKTKRRLPGIWKKRTVVKKSR